MISNDQLIESVTEKHLQRPSFFDMNQKAAMSIYKVIKSLNACVVELKKNPKEKLKQLNIIEELKSSSGNPFFQLSIQTYEPTASMLGKNALSRLIRKFDLMYNQVTMKEDKKQVLCNAYLFCDADADIDDEIWHTSLLKRFKEIPSEKCKIFKGMTTDFRII